MKQREVYSEEIMKLWKNPKNFGKIKSPTHEFSEVNNLCGDDMTVQIIIKDGVIKDAKFTSTGCLVCIVFGSELTEKIRGMDVEDVMKMTKEELVKSMNINIHPGKIYCAALSLEAVQNCLEKGKKV